MRVPSLVLLLLRLLIAAAGALQLASADYLATDSIAGQDHERQKPAIDAFADAKVIAELEKSLMKMLGMSSRPKPKAKPPAVPDFLIQLQRRQNIAGVVDMAKRGLNIGAANTARAFVHVESELDDKFTSPHRFRLMFNVSGLIENEALHAAELVLNRVALGEDNHHNDNDTEDNEVDPKKRLVRIMVHDIVRPGVRGKNGPILRLLDSKILDIRSNQSVSLDVRPALDRWLSRRPFESENHGLLVKVIGDAVAEGSPYHKKEHVRLRRSLEDDNYERNRAVLFAYTNDGNNRMTTAQDIMNRRARRADARKNRRKDGRENCRRYPLYVDFADVGWNDWIVAPPGYDAYYCHGDCPFPLSDHLNSTNHAIVQNLVYSTNPALVPKACCVPTTLSSISMLYLDEESKVVLKNYQDMSVQGCGCR